MPFSHSCTKKFSLVLHSLPNSPSKLPHTPFSQKRKLGFLRLAEAGGGRRDGLRSGRNDKSGSQKKYIQEGGISGRGKSKVDLSGAGREVSGTLHSPQCARCGEALILRPRTRAWDA